ncbi:MAG: heparinase [Candidatus Hydrogenedentota bacterium]
MRCHFVVYGLALLGFLTPGAAFADELSSLDPEGVFDKLDLSDDAMRPVATALADGGEDAALTALREHYREKYPLPVDESGLKESTKQEADDVVNHIFQWGPYEKADYGDDMDWAWDPRGDIEWVAAVYRFHWADALVSAYLATRDEKYAQAFVELTTDWIAKHPLEERNVAHPVYTNWQGYPWLDIQTGIRASRLCMAFPVMVHAEAFTPEFLGVFLASMYDHQKKTELEPMGKIHNKAIFEQRGFVNIASTFPEFKESRGWMGLALERARENLLAQTTADGVQREWSGGYHRGVMRDAVEIMEKMEPFGIPIPEDYRERVRLMHEYLFAMATPDLGFTMFGDTSRTYPTPDRRASMDLYSTLINASETLDDPKYAARATLDRDKLPQQTSYAFPEAGMYFLRNQWGTEQTYFALHCSPPAISGHDHPDNGTFELYANGRWFITDSGYYTYGHDPEARDWHRQTRVHNTLTVDGKVTAVDGRLVAWADEPEFDAVCVENNSYEGITHRRTVWFVDHRFLVLYDEALGDVDGTVEVHYQLAPGDVEVDRARKRVRTKFDDANILIWMDENAPVTLDSSDGWMGWYYGKREPRTSVRYAFTGEGPARFVTALVPFSGEAVPEGLSAHELDIAEADSAFEVSLPNATWQVGRSGASLWCRPGHG